MTKLATKPAYCVSCYQQDPIRYVDFEAAYDGPLIPGSPRVSVDDLIICENCLAYAFALLDPQGLKQTITELEDVVLLQADALDAKDKTIIGAKATIEELVDHPVAKFPGKPRLVGVSDEVRRRITQGRFERRGTSPAPKTKPKVQA